MKAIITFFALQIVGSAIAQQQKEENNKQIEEIEELEEIVLTTQYRTTENLHRVNNTQIAENFNGSLASTLQHLPGVDTQQIGSMNAKFIIRGLGSNRLLIVENGLRMEAQQWGADHGLEIDALGVERIDIIKGAGAIAYGSDAIAGVVKINNETLPPIGLSGRAVLSFLGNNHSIGNAWYGAIRNQKHFVKLKANYTDYGDFRVPTTQVNYLQTRIPIYNGVLTNTAGDEKSFTAQWGYTAQHFLGILSLSAYYNKSGFFAGAHGVPSVAKTLSDGNSRNIGFPYQTARHLKAMYHAQWKKTQSTWDIRLGFQRNLRREFSAFHSHFPNQPTPVIDSNKELEFSLTSWDQALSYKQEIGLQHQIETGVQSQWVENKVGGYSFLLPKYQRKSVGAFAKWLWQINEKQSVEIGGRWDVAHLSIAGYYDPILFEYLITRNLDYQRATNYAWRSREVFRSFSQGNLSVGFAFPISKKWQSIITLGSNFRFPTAIELAANGIHHGAFRHEQGNQLLDTEKGYTLDWNHDYQYKNLKINTSVYTYYFSNYIFLKPSGKFSALPHGGQLYTYDQSRALLAGVEFAVSYNYGRWNWQNVSEIIYNTQLGAVRYALPFTTPTNTVFSIGYTLPEWKKIKSQQIEVSYKFAAQQNRIAQNEEPTPGYALCNLKYQVQIPWKKNSGFIQLRIQNLWNTKYYLHNSFYRAIEIPAMGRSVDLVIKLTF